MEKRIPIGTKYPRVVGIIEKAFKASNKEILSSIEITNWVKDNYPRSNLGQRRVSSFLRRRPQFVYHTSARRRNSNTRDHWYSLGPSNETIFIEMNWVEYQPNKMDKRHHNKRKRRRQRRRTDLSKHKKRGRKKEKINCALCEIEFTPHNEGDKICSLPACQSLSDNVTSGESYIPKIHPDHYDKTDDPAYLRQPSTDDVAITAEKERVVGMEKKRKRPQNFLRYTELHTMRDEWIEDYDGNVVRTYNSVESRTRAFTEEAAKTQVVKSHLNSVIKKHTRSG